MKAPRTILVCDDEHRLRELMKVTLGDQYCYLEAEDADEALALARENHPDLVLLDVMLPGRSGIELLRELRAEPGLEEVPVVVVSAWQTGGDNRAALEAGADAFLGKPFNVDELSAIVHALLEDEQAQ